MLFGENTPLIKLTSLIITHNEYAQILRVVFPTKSITVYVLNLNKQREKNSHGNFQPYQILLIFYK